MPKFPGNLKWAQKLAQAAAKEKIQLYLVGGFLRDELLGRFSADLDLCGPPGTLEWITSFARLEGLSLQFVRRHGLARLKVEDMRLDISVWRGNSLEEDLSLRDFTVNAMALPLADYLGENPANWRLTDPYQGRRDVINKRLVALPGALQADPVRILRGARLVRHLGLRPEADTVRQCNMNASSLAAAPRERVGTEILSALDYGAAGYLPLLSALGADEPLFGARLGTGPDYIVNRLEKILCHGYEDLDFGAVDAHLQKQLTIPHNRLHLLRLAALCRQLGVTEKSITFLSARRERGALAQNLAALSRLENTLDISGINQGSRYFLTFGDAAPEGLLLFAAAGGPVAYRKALPMLRAFASGDRLAKPPRFLRGDVLAREIGRRRLDIANINKADTALLLAAAQGEISDLQQAYSFLQGFADGKNSELLSKKRSRGRNG